MIPELLQRIRENKRAQRIILISMFCFFALIAAILLWPRETYEQHKLVKTNLSDKQNFGYLSGSNIYAYNGLAFYKIDRSANDAITVLHSGTKLAVPAYLYWANDQGALLTFKGSFISSEVDKEIRARGLRPNNKTQSFTWYFDFASGNLRLVNELPILPHLAVFSEADKGFYYLPSVEDAPLHFYNIQTDQDEVISDDLNLTDVSYLGTCPDQKVCLIARDSDDSQFQRLFGINRNNQKNQLIDSRGRLFTTNQDNLYISVKADELPEAHGQERFEEEDVLYEEAPARLHDLHGGPVKDLGFDVGNSDVITHVKNSNEFFALDNSLVKDQATEDEMHEYREGKIEGLFGDPQNRLFPLSFFDDDKPLRDGILDNASHGKNESLLTTFADNQLLFTTKEQKQDLIPINQSEAQAKVNQCMQSHAKDSQYFDEDGLFKIFFAQNADISNNIKLFSDCLLKSDISTVIGFNYYFGGISPDGRITTD